MLRSDAEADDSKVSGKQNGMPKNAVQRLTHQD
jgi:hypothetical protein